MTTTDLRYPVLNREAKRRLIPRLPNTSPKVPFGLGAGGLGAGGWGWVLVGWTGLVLSANPETARRLVYRSAALVAFLT